MDSPIPGLDTREFALIAWVAIGLMAALFSSFLRPLGQNPETPVELEAPADLRLHGRVGDRTGVGTLEDHLWSGDLISETSFWFLFVGVPILVGAATATGDEDFFRKAALSTIAATAFVEFVVNLRPFNLWVEVLMVPPILLLFGTLAYSQVKEPETHTAGVLLDLAFAVPIFLVGYTVVGVVSEPRQFFTYVNLLELFLPILLTLGVIPFTYAVALVTSYGTLFTHLALKLGGRQHRGMRRYAKRKSIRAAHVSLGRVHRLASSA